LGNLTFYDSSGQNEYNFTKPYSEKTAELIDKEISNLIESQYKRAINLLEVNKDKLTQLAEILLEKEVIFKDDLQKIFGNRPFDKKEEDIPLITNKNEKKPTSSEKTEDSEGTEGSSPKQEEPNTSGNIEDSEITEDTSVNK
ncbi:MAG: peptidase M41, partial [Gillisia sp.]|nr:peptidase M41 [Gillisia sp.]